MMAESVTVHFIDKNGWTEYDAYVYDNSVKNIYNYYWIKYNIIITQLETKSPNSQWQIGKEKILLFSFDCHTELTYKMYPYYIF